MNLLETLNEKEWNKLTYNQKSTLTDFVANDDQINQLKGMKKKLTENVKTVNELPDDSDEIDSLTALVNKLKKQSEKDVVYEFELISKLKNDLIKTKQNGNSLNNVSEHKVQEIKSKLRSTFMEMKSTVEQINFVEFVKCKEVEGLKPSFDRYL